jgi:hypothetical protein
MADAITLEFLSRQSARILSELRDMRLLLATLPGIRDEIGLLREEVRLTRAHVARLDDTITINVLDRIQKLEADATPQS